MAPLSLHSGSAEVSREVAIQFPAVLPLTVASSWGSFVLNVWRECGRAGVRVRAPIPLMDSDLSPVEGFALSSVQTHAPGLSRDDPIVISLERFHWQDPADSSAVSLGVVDSIPDELSLAHRETASRWSGLIAGSLWAYRRLVLAGICNVHFVPAGVDTSVFHSRAKSGWLANRFAVFGVAAPVFDRGTERLLEAFERFRDHHPEAVLILAGGAQAPADSQVTRQDSAVSARPGVLATGPLTPIELADVLRDCDVAVFPDRCQAGTARWALEAMACGVPVMLSPSTANLDLFGDHAYGLGQLNALSPHDDALPGMAWGECSAQEITRALERAWRARGEFARKGRAAVQVAKAWTWRRTLDGMLLAARQPSITRQLTSADTYRWGVSLHWAGLGDEAEKCYSQVLAQDPTHIKALGDRGNVRRDAGQFAGAEADFREILRLQPGNAMAWHSLGRLMRCMGRYLDAAQAMARALTIEATAARHWDMAWTLLAMGEYGRAWPHFEYRHEALGLRRLPPSKPRWQGGAGEGTLLILDEQGLGDTLQFLRFLPLAAGRWGKEVMFAGKPAVLGLVQRVLPQARVVSWDTDRLPASAAWVPLMSLPAVLGVQGPQDIPGPSPVALPDPGCATQWRTRVRGQGEEPVVALCWQGNPDFSGDSRRSPGLEALLPLVRMPGIRWVSVQVGAGREDLKALAPDDAARIDDVGQAIEAAGMRLEDTLAVLENCDLVVSGCTSVVHMAGLLGRPSLVLLAAQADWRWMLERTDSPWYPSLTLLRQPRDGDWDAPVTLACQAIRKRLLS